MAYQFSKILNQTSLGFTKKLLQKFPQAEIYLVGGATRDILLSRKTQDFDFVVRNIKIRDLEKFLQRQGKVNLVGKRFGVFKFIPKNSKLKEAIDIVLPRTEHSLKNMGGYRDFKIQTNPLLPIEKDLKRRDFTINALAWNLKTRSLVDITNGVQDLKQKIIRTVGKAETRFKEDYSRMLRALRLALELDFKIETKTSKALKKLMPQINRERTIRKKQERIVPYEVIAKEILKSFKASPVQALELWDKSGTIKELIPELLKMKDCPQPKNWHSEGDVWQHTLLSLKKLSSPQFKKQFPDQEISPELIMALLFHDLGKPYTIQTPKKDKVDRIRFNEHDRVGAKLAQKICQRLKLSSYPPLKVELEKVAWLVQNHLLLIHGRAREMKNSTIEKYFFNKRFSGQNLLKLLLVDALATLPPSGKPSLKNFNQIIKRVKQLKKINYQKNILPKSLTNGHDIMKRFKLPPGPQIGKLLQMIREEQLAQRIKTKKQALDFLKNKI